jgi:hypothetical protein
MYNCNCKDVDIYIYIYMEYVGLKLQMKPTLLCRLRHQLDNIGRVLSAFLYLRLFFLSEILPLFADEQDSRTGLLLRVIILRGVSTYLSAPSPEVLYVTLLHGKHSLV